MTTLSLCLLVRDEEELLPAFLESVAGCWDELVAVDTGSVDGTKALLAAAGARILDVPWTGDFAAARNAGLAAATGEWALVLDADERPGPGFAQELRALCAEDAVGAATVAMRNHLAHGHTRDVALLRLFRLRPTTRYRHAIHEDAFASVQAMLREEGRELAALHTPVDHLGYLPDRVRDKGKKERDRDALQALLARDPDDLYSWFKLLEVARFWGDGPLLQESAPPARAALLRSPPLDETRPWGGDLVALLALAAGDEGLAELEALAPRVAPSAALLLARGERLEEAGELDAAADAFDACLDLGEDPTAQLVLTRPLLGLARVALAQGRLEDALEDVDSALETAPRDSEALLAALSLRTGAERAAFAQELRARFGDTLELVRAEGEAALLAGEAAEAVPSLARAAGSPPSGRVALRLAQAQLLAGEAEASRATLTAVLPALPEAGIGLVVADVLAGRTTDLSLELTQDQANAALMSWLRLLEGRADLLTTFILRSEPLQTVFPWLAELRA